MPGFITHYICAQAVARGLPVGARGAFDRFPGIYNMGAQGPDIFFYYLPGLIKKRTRGVGVIMHRKKVGLYIQTLIEKCARAEQGETRDLLFAYTAGYLTHYALDAAAHPYVYARTAHGAAVKRQVSHRKFETAIDVLMLKLSSGEKPADYKLWQLIHSDARHTYAAASAVSAAVNATYAREVKTKDVYKAMTHMIQLTRVLQSKNGRRKKMMELTENLLIGENVVSSIIHAQEIKDGTDYLNMEKTVWNPEKNDSFLELYGEAVTKASGMILMLYRYLSGDVNKEELASTIGSRSLANGAETD